MKRAKEEGRFLRATNRSGRRGVVKYRRKRWVDSGEGIVHKKIRVIRVKGGRRKPPVKDPGPRPLPRPQRPARPSSPGSFGVYRGKFGRLEATRLLNRAGFGPSPGQAEKLAKLGLKKAVLSLTRPQGKSRLVGPPPVDGDGVPIAPADSWGHDHLWWLDRMVRSNQPFAERMALIFHDWFATSIDGVSTQQQMIDQYWTIRSHVNGKFDAMLLDLTKDPAMLQWLDGGSNDRWSPNENYAREMMELFTLGADRDAYTEDDIREAARALTGWNYDWVDDVGTVNFRYEEDRHDDGIKTVFGRRGRWQWQDACRLCVEHQLHPGFFVEKLWSYFVPTPPSKSTKSALVAMYRNGGTSIRPVVEAILMHPDFYRCGPMVKPPVVFAASLMRSLKLSITDEDWIWLGSAAGQRLFEPPNVSGWDDERWLDTSTVRARWLMVTLALESRHADVWGEQDPYATSESTRQALNRALETFGWPALRSEHQKELISLSERVPRQISEEWQQSPYLAMRQNALLQLIAISPDMQLS